MPALALASVAMLPAVLPVAALRGVIVATITLKPADLNPLHIVDKSASTCVSVRPCTTSLLPQQTIATLAANGVRSSGSTWFVTSDCCCAIVCPGSASSSGLNDPPNCWHSCHG